MTRERRWFASRGAYAPRLGPQMIVCAVLGGLIGLVSIRLLGAWGLLAMVLPCVAVAGLVVQVRWWLWERQHPVLPYSVRWRREYVDRDLTNWRDRG